MSEYQNAKLIILSMLWPVVIAVLAWMGKLNDQRRGEETLWSISVDWVRDFYSRQHTALAHA